MWIEEQESDTAEALDQVWQAWQDTPSYAERFRDGRSTFDAEEQGPAQTFCPVCGFWVDSQHQCSAHKEQEVA
jgi:hypothetical protein